MARSTKIYASHVLDHLSGPELYKAAGEIARVLKPDGRYLCSVPSIDALFRLFLDSADDLGKQIKILAMVYGNHAHDIHHFGFNFSIMADVLAGGARVSMSSMCWMSFPIPVFNTSMAN